MPPRENPTARQVRLGAELRRMRERGGRTAKAAAGLLGVDQARMSNIEAGRLGIGEDRLRRLAAFYMCDDAALIEALCVIAKERRGTYWWDEYRGVLPTGFLDIAELEHHASYLRSLQTLSLPGLFQTPEYARTLFSSVVTSHPEGELEARVEHRMKRQAVLHGPESKPLAAVIHEAALRMRFGGPKVTGRQLKRILELSELPNITVRVLPFSCERFIEVTQPVLYLGGQVPQLDTVQMDSSLGGIYLDAEAELAQHRRYLDLAEEDALSVRSSREFIHRLTKEM